jgi:hypothetical protein|tara:strand:+ start:293 stop:1261 length:969 start_codon:yes stop_codon:yes gene_type:complete
VTHRFSFANALFHFARASGPGGFIWKYALTYLAGVTLMAGLAYFLFQPLIKVAFDTALRAAQGLIAGEEVEIILTREVTGMVGRIAFSWILLIILGVLFWVVFEAAIHRRYVREEGFRLSLGGDELRLLLVGLLWFVFFIISYLLSLILAGILIAIFVTIGDGETFFLGLGFPAVFLVTGLAWAYVAVRLSPASALTVRDRRVHFFHAWGASRGRVLPLFFAYAILAVAFWFIFTIAYSAGAAALVATLMSNFNDIDQMEANPAEVLMFFLKAEFLAPAIGTYVVLLMLQGLFFYVWAGPAGLAAKTDPRGGGTAQAPDVFA